MEFRHLLRVLSAHRRMIGLLCLSAAVNAVLLTYLIPEKYEASSLVLIRPQEALRFSGADKALLDFPVNFAIPFQTISRTYSEVIQSRTVAEKVARAVGLDKPAGDEGWGQRLAGAAKGLLAGTWTLLKYGRIGPRDPLEESIRTVAACLAVTPTKETFVFKISCRFAKPRLSAAIANAASASFVDYSREANAVEAKGASEFIAARLRDSEREFEQARRALKEFKESRGTILLDRELAARIGEVARLDAALADNEKEIGGAQAEIAGLASELREQQPYLRSSSTVSDNPVAMDLKKELAHLEVERSELLMRLTTAHPKILALDARVAEIRGLLQQSEQRVVSQETSSLNAVYQQLEQRSLLSQASLQGLQAQAGRLRALLGARRRELASVSGTQSELIKLELALETSEETYRLIKKRYDEARIHELERLSDIRVVSPATVPVYPVSPIKIQHVAVSLLLAAVLGALAALVLDFWNLRLRSVEEAERALGLPVLAAIPYRAARGSA